MYIDPNDSRETTFLMRFRKVPNFTTQLTEIYLRPGIEKNVAIPLATNDTDFDNYYFGTHDLPAGASVSSTVDYGNTFEFTDITNVMNGTYEFNISACSSVSCYANSSYSIPVVVNKVPSIGIVNSSYSYHADSSQSLSLVGMAVDAEGNDVLVSISNL